MNIRELDFERVRYSWLASSCTIIVVEWIEHAWRLLHSTLRKSNSVSGLS
jgi:hypothetical protein